MSAHLVTLMLHCSSSAEEIFTPCNGRCSLARHHGRDVYMESCTAAFHRQSARQRPKWNMVVLIQHSNYFAWCQIDSKNSKQTPHIVWFPGSQWRYFSNNKIFQWKILWFCKSCIFQMKIPDGVEGHDIAINTSESELCLTEHECPRFLPRCCS